MGVNTKFSKLITTITNWWLRENDKVKTINFNYHQIQVKLTWHKGLPLQLSLENYGNSIPLQFLGDGWWNFQIYFLTNSKQRHDISSTDGSTEALVDWKSDKLYVAKHFTVMQRWKAKAGTASNVTLLLLRKFHMTLWHDQQKPTTKPRKTHKFLFFHLSKRVIFMFQQHLRNIWPPFTHCNMSTAAWLCRITSSEDIQLLSTKWNVSFCADFR